MKLGETRMNRMSDNRNAEIGNDGAEDGDAVVAAGENVMVVDGPGGNAEIGNDGPGGNPDDDGYLSAPEWQSDIAQQLNEQSYRLLYESYVNNPFNYSSPRTIRLGVIVNF